MHAGRHRERGFTLLEMMVVIVIMLILLAIAIPRFGRSIARAKEDMFRQNLETLNKTINQYTLDKQKPPNSLEDLKAAGYIDKVPNDITGRDDTWAVEEDAVILSLEQTDTGVTGVHSGSNMVGSNGKAYAEW
jgi:general secretion pathway protein G